MDDDIKANLHEVGKNIEALGRQLESSKIEITGLADIHEALLINADTLLSYIRTQSMRLNGV